MSDTSTVFGISMGPQRNRRLLVAVLYALCLASLMMGVTAPYWFRELGLLIRQLFAFALILPFLASLVWFTQLAKFRPLGLRPVSVEIIRLGLTPGPRDPYDPDEREVALRKAAHYQAFRFMIFYGCLLATAFIFTDHLKSATAHRLMMALFALLVQLVFTLPQAIVLWTEPDVPEEDGV